MRLFLLTMLVMFAQSTWAGTRRIQDQGSSPYCLYAVNAYLVNGDMWRLAAEYQRRDMPTFDGLVPLNNSVQDLAIELYGGAITGNQQWDTTIIRTVVQRGTPVAVSGSGHAIVLLSWSQTGRITYVDSLHSEAPQQIQDTDFWIWWDGWGWWSDVDSVQTTP